jgi:hypothetical protein
MTSPSGIGTNSGWAKDVEIGRGKNREKMICDYGEWERLPFSGRNRAT